ncbi:MAG TPA: AAA family ATPase [Candidatus Competibacter phosphatis]|nr:AAA family ATPase [Candidatus Competibacter phosphatis]
MPNFLRRVKLKNYKSIAACDVQLGPLTFLVGPNGSGKSNFLDALHFVRDALVGSLDNALNERGGLNEVRRRSSGHPNHFGVRLEFQLASGKAGYYAFNVGARPAGGYEVQREECALGGIGQGPYFCVEAGQVVKCSEPTFPAITADRLALVSGSGLSAFRPVFDALAAMGFYNLNPKVIRELQKPQDGRLLKSAGDNIVSVVGHLMRVAPQNKVLIEEYLNRVVPSVHGVERMPVGPMESLSFRQDTAGSTHPWRFLAMNMSDGTLRALGILIALFQGTDSQGPTLVGIEEPEIALHPAAAGALREALHHATEHTQVLVTSHSPELLDDESIPADALIAVVADSGVSKLAPIDSTSCEMLRQRLYTAGELLRLDQLEPDADTLNELGNRQFELFGAATV